MSFAVAAAAAARLDDLGPVVELRITVELRRWQAAEALGLLEAGSPVAAAAVLAQHALHAHETAADGEALLAWGSVTVSHPDGNEWRADSTVLDADGPVIDLVHPGRSAECLAMAPSPVDLTATPTSDPPPSRWMSTFTRRLAPC